MTATAATTSKLAAKLIADLNMADAIELRMAFKDVDTTTPAGRAQQMLVMVAVNAVTGLEHAEKAARTALSQMKDVVSRQDMNLALGHGPQAAEVTHAAVRYAEACTRVAELVAQFEGAATPLKLMLGIGN